MLICLTCCSPNGTCALLCSNKHYTLLPVTAAHDIAADSPLAKGQLQQAAEEAASDAVARKQALTAALWVRLRYNPCFPCAMRMLSRS
jgi:hypothetical protein